MEDNKYNALKNNLMEVANEIDSVTDKLNAYTFETKVQFFKETVRALLVERYNSATGESFSESCDWAINKSWFFANKVEQSIAEHAKEAGVNIVPTKNEIATEIVDKLTDDFILNEVGNRGLVLDVAAAHEGLLATYGYIKK